MKQLAVAAALAVILAQPAAPAFAQTISNQCFAMGDMAGQVVSWRKHKKTKAQAQAQAAKYYGDDADRQAMGEIIEKIYSPDGAHMTPDQASMFFTDECARRQPKPAANGQ
ncbi:hypothetical protein [Paraburkholderia sp.]|uniref:hypothetical protein n=1 Tax=Paraburkholderia sp. TaxID=1926495 RepID=UPI00239D3F46|nr:hypothetical protein [Paraburkholderia sp.]MDE1182433.1 hypothetical protein [Paraburkholderia sp.]